MTSSTRSASLDSIASSDVSITTAEHNPEPTPLEYTTTHIERPTISDAAEDSLGSTEIDASCPEWAEFKAWKQRREEAKAMNITPKALERHSCFFLPIENIFFSVGNTIYSVPRAPFDKHSSAFTGKGLNEDDPLVLENIKPAHLDHFLSILFPPEYGTYTASTVEEWTAILHLADRWGFQSIKKLAIKHLTPIANDVDKIILGRQLGISQWLDHAYLAVCLREHNLTEEEGRGMSVEDIIKISTIRQQFGLGSRPNVALPLSIGEVRTRFGLVGHDLVSSTDDFDHTAFQANLGTSSAVITPGEGRSSMDTESETSALTASGGDIAVSENSQALQRSAEAAAELERAARAKEREITERALKAYSDIRYNELDNTQQRRFLDARTKIQEDIRKQEMLDFIASFKAEAKKSEDSS